MTYRRQAIVRFSFLCTLGCSSFVLTAAESAARTGWEIVEVIDEFTDAEDTFAVALSDEGNALLFASCSHRATLIHLLFRGILSPADHLLEWRRDTDAAKSSVARKAAVEMGRNQRLDRLSSMLSPGPSDGITLVAPDTLSGSEFLLDVRTAKRLLARIGTHTGRWSLSPKETMSVVRTISATCATE